MLDQDIWGKGFLKNRDITTHQCIENPEDGGGEELERHRNWSRGTLSSWNKWNFHRNCLSSHGGRAPRCRLCQPYPLRYPLFPTSFPETNVQTIPSSQDAWNNRIIREREEHAGGKCPGESGCGVEQVGTKLSCLHRKAEKVTLPQLMALWSWDKAMALISSHTAISGLYRNPKT